MNRLGIGPILTEGAAAATLLAGAAAYDAAPVAAQESVVDLEFELCGAPNSKLTIDGLTLDFTAIPDGTELIAYKVPEDAPATPCESGFSWYNERHAAGMYDQEELKVTDEAVLPLAGLVDCGEHVQVDLVTAGTSNEVGPELTQEEGTEQYQQGDVYGGVVVEVVCEDGSTTPDNSTDNGQGSYENLARTGLDLLTPGRIALLLVGAGAAAVLATRDKTRQFIAGKSTKRI